MLSLSFIQKLSLFFVVAGVSWGDAYTIPSQDHSRHRSYSYMKNDTGFPTYVLPLSNGTASLPPPSANLTLQSFSIIRGTWNYTCANESAVPVSIGGIAAIFDPYPPAAYLSQEEFHQFSASLVNESISEISEKLQPIGDFYQLEVHLGVMNIGNGTHFLGTLDSEISAPKGSPVGPAGSPALIWAKFKATPGSYGGVEAYRVNSAGGVAPATCAGFGDHFELDFSGESWMYG